MFTILRISMVSLLLLLSLIKKHQVKIELQAAEKEGNSAKIREKETAYAEAKARKESWEDGGANKRRMDAAVMAITAVLSGGSTGQVAVAALSPELNAQIHELTKDSKTANLLAHAALSALEAKASGTSATAGAIAGVAGEATAMLLAETVFNKQPNELTTEEKNLLKVAGQLAGAVAGQASGSTTVDTVFGAGTAKRAVENNYLSKSEAERKRILENKLHSGVITQQELNELNAIYRKDRDSDRDLISACEGNPLSAQCQTERQKLEQAKFSYSGADYTPTGYNYPTYTRYSDLYPEDYGKVASFSENYDVLRNAKVKANADFYEATGLDPSWFDKVDTANTVVASIAGTKLSATEPSKTTQPVPKLANANERLPVVGKTTGYEEQNITLFNELTHSGVKFTKDSVVSISKLSNGKIVFLEKGNLKAGLTHIVESHGSDFARKGISEKQIPDLLMKSLEANNIVGYQGKGYGRPIYEVNYLGKIHHIAITVGSNGFIVGANPAKVGSK